jgi:glutaminyl-peptide cyclotransferase
MKKTVFFITVFLFFVIVICSCAGKSEHSRKPFSTVELIPARKNYIIGQSLTFKVNTKLRKGQLKTVRLILNDKLLTTSDLSQFTAVFPILDKAGINTIRILAETTEGISNTRIQNFTVLSDIKPKNYSYTIVNKMAHPVDHFTQGFEIHNGFLYEGTGENGKSGLFKINISNSKILQSKFLPEVYWGEGITILNNKIYQLTYKNRICFVYNLSDFAVIDSFRFNSEEGWGLTNDGKSLIMSDGTETLTWIDPDNYSIIKRIQATDDQKVVQYLNELEYVNGNIWANVWTTNQILFIDAENGKVKGFLDLSGILNTMPHKQTDRIDVLNGIAILPESGNLLVTGKLWPKMFEIKVIVSK